MIDVIDRMAQDLNEPENIDNLYTILYGRFGIKGMKVRSGQARFSPAFVTNKKLVSMQHNVMIS